MNDLILNWLMDGAPNTRKAYRYSITSFEKWLGRDPVTATHPEIQRWRNHLSEDLGRSDSTVRRHLSAISSFLNYAVNQDVIDKNPAANVSRPQGETSKRKPLSLDQLTDLLEAADRHSKAAVALVWLMLSGCRVSEACNADIDDVSDDGVTVTIKGGDRETKPLDPPAMRAVREAISDRHDGPLLINRNTGQRLTRKRGWELVRSLSKKAGIKRPVTDHELRNTAASLAADAGASIEEIQAMLGHKDPRTTQRYMKDRNKALLAARASRKVGDAITEAMGR